MKLKLTEITSPEEVNKIKSNVKDLEELVKNLENKINSKEANIKDIMVFIDQINKKDIPNINTIIESQKDQILSLNKEIKRIDSDKLSKSTYENEIKKTMTELQKNQKELKDKVANIKD